MSALKQASTGVYEPIHRFQLDIPADTLTQLIPGLPPPRATVRTQEMRESTCLVEGEIPAPRVHELRQQLPGLTRGEGVLESTFDHYEPVRGSLPARRRTDHNPLDRENYLLQQRRHP